jgi:hypothetical protein
MSDPVTNAEVEDVLSSIRRLVSEDKRPLQMAQRENVSDRLVLTPALRVAKDTRYPDQDDRAEEQGPHYADVQGDAVTDNDEAPADVLVLDQPHDALARDTDTPADVSDNDQQAEKENSGTYAFDDPAHDYDADPYNFADDEDNDGEGSKSAFIEEPDHAAPESDYDAAAPAQDEHVPETVEAEQQEAQTQHDEPQLPPTEEAQVADQALSPTSKAAALRAKIEELEAAIGGISGSWDVGSEPSALNSSNSKDAMAWEDESPEDAITSRMPAYEPEAEPSEQDGFLLSDGLDASPDEGSDQSDHAPKEDDNSAQVDVKTGVPSALDYGDEDQLIDEEALRDMVSEIVRAELQGALGERITRNVRKLVRREIHRALTAQDLE